MNIIAFLEKGKGAPSIALHSPALPVGNLTSMTSIHAR